jgi:hypothetical protein
MKRTIVVAFVAAAIVGVCAGCDNPFSPGKSVVLGVMKIDAPATVAAGTVITGVLTVGTGGCLSFDHIDVNRDLNGANMTVWGRDAARKGVGCPQNVVYEPHSFKFDPPFGSSFTIQVNQGRLAPLQTIVQVQ